MRLLLPVVFVQPFADIVANYTCCDRNKKRHDKFLHQHSPPFCWRFGSNCIVSFAVRKICHILVTKLENFSSAEGFLLNACNM